MKIVFTIRNVYMYVYVYAGIIHLKIWQMCACNCISPNARMFSEILNGFVFASFFLHLPSRSLNLLLLFFFWFRHCICVLHFKCNFVINSFNRTDCRVRIYYIYSYYLILLQNFMHTFLVMPLGFCFSFLLSISTAVTNKINKIVGKTTFDIWHFTQFFAVKPNRG